jgi:hypothetical protein
MANDPVLRVELVDWYRDDPMARQGPRESPVEDDPSASTEAREAILANARGLGATTSHTRKEERVESQEDYIARRSRGLETVDDPERSSGGRDRDADIGGPPDDSHSIFGVPPSEISEIFTIAVGAGGAGALLKGSQSLLRQWLVNRGTRRIRVVLPEEREIEMQGYSDKDFRKLLTAVSGSAPEPQSDSPNAVSDPSAAEPDADGESPPRATGSP